MGGVDYSDQVCGYYHVRLKCMKNYKYMFWFLFHVAITNVFTLQSYMVSTTPPLELKKFRMRLAEQLIGRYMSRKRSGRPRKCLCPSSTSTTLTNTHLPSHSFSQRCVYCRVVRCRPRRKESVWTCMACDGHPSLCLTGKQDSSDCFSLWHASEHLKN